MGLEILMGFGLFFAGMASGDFVIALCLGSGNSKDKDQEDREQIEYLRKYNSKQNTWILYEDEVHISTK